MIPKHDQFIAAMNEKKKICVRYYSRPDSGVLDRVCAPMDYGPGSACQDGLNRYWLWDYLADTGSQNLGLVAQQIVDLRVLGEEFDPSQCITGPAAAPVLPVDVVPAVKMTPNAGATVPAA